MSGSKEYSVPRLKDETNYITWSQRAEAYLMVHGHIENINQVVDKSNSKWKALPPTDKEKDYKALATLKLLVYNSPLNYITIAKTLREA